MVQPLATTWHANPFCRHCHVFHANGASPRTSERLPVMATQYTTIFLTCGAAVAKARALQVRAVAIACVAAGLHGVKVVSKLRSQCMAKEAKTQRIQHCVDYVFSLNGQGCRDTPVCRDTGTRPRLVLQNNALSLLRHSRAVLCCIYCT